MPLCFCCTSSTLPGPLWVADENRTSIVNYFKAREKKMLDRAYLSRCASSDGSSIDSDNSVEEE